MLKNNINRGMSRSFLKTGIVCLAAAAGIFTYKNFTGYTKVTKVATYNNCKVVTWAETNTVNGGNLYYVEAIKLNRDRAEIDFDRFYNDAGYDVYNDSISKDDTETVLFQGSVSWTHLKHFINYSDNKLTVYKTDKGKEFPVYDVDCDAREAEREYRRIDRPVRWYTLYAVLSVLGIFCLVNYYKQAKVARNFENENYQFVPQKGYETLEGGIASLNIEREKMYDKNLQAYELSRFNNHQPRRDARYALRNDTTFESFTNEHRWKQREWRNK